MTNRNNMRLLVTALACSASGLAAVWATAGPDHVATLFPPAGIGIAALLLYGRRMLIAVFLGALALVLTAWPTEIGRVAIIVAVALALTRLLHVVIAAALLRRFLPPGADPPSSAREIVAILSLAGPLACIASAAGGVLVLNLMGLLSADQVLSTGIRWWVADTLGVAAFLPTSLSLFAQPRFEWRPMRVTVALPLLLVSSVIAAALAREETSQRLTAQAEFSRKGENAARALSENVDDVLLTLEATHSFAASSNLIDRTEFRRFTTPFLQRSPLIHAIGLADYVLDQDRDAFVAKMRERYGSSFEIRDRIEDNKLVPARRRPQYTVISLIEPLQRNRRALGLDSLSVDIAEPAIRQAIRTGGQIATSGFELTQAPGLGVVIYQSVARRRAISDEFDALASIHPSAVVFVALQASELAMRSFAPIARDLGYCLVDVTTDVRGVLVGGSDCSSSEHDSRLSWRGQVTVAGRQWELRLRPLPNEVGIGAAIGGSMSSLAAMFGTLTLASFLMSVGGRAGQVTRLVDLRTRKLAEEIVERRRITGALARSEQRLRTLLGSTPAGIVEMTPDNRIQQANPHLCELLRVREATLIGRRLLDLTHPADRTAESAAWNSLIERAASKTVRRLRLLRGDGTPVRVDAVTTSILDAQGQTVRIVSVVQDLSEAELRRAAENAREKAEAASRAKTDFVARMSHELRTPLNALLGFAQLLSNRPDEPLSHSQAEAVRVIEQSGWHLLEMINDLLELSRIESGHVRVELRPVAVGPVIAECAHLLDTLCSGASVSIASDIAPDARHVIADPTRLRQVLLNLLSNAIKYNRAGGLVRVETVLEAPDRVALRVSDNGLGMTPLQLEHLFEPFNRLGHDDSIQGTGIGLTIALNMVTLMNGRLSVESQPGSGSCFTVSLPAAQTSAEDSSPAHADPARMH